MFSGVIIFCIIVGEMLVVVVLVPGYTLVLMKWIPNQITDKFTSTW